MSADKNKTITENAAPEPELCSMTVADFANTAQCRQEKKEKACTCILEEMVIGDRDGTFRTDGTICSVHDTTEEAAVSNFSDEFTCCNAEFMDGPVQKQCGRWAGHAGKHSPYYEPD